MRSGAVDIKILMNVDDCQFALSIYRSNILETCDGDRTVSIYSDEQPPVYRHKKGQIFLPNREVPPTGSVTFARAAAEPLETNVIAPDQPLPLTLVRLQYKERRS